MKVPTKEFESYLDMVMQLSSKSTEDLVVVADNIQWDRGDKLSETPPELVIKRIRGFGEIKSWIGEKMKPSGNTPMFK